MAGTSDFLKGKRICKGNVCLSSDKAGLHKTAESFTKYRDVCDICGPSEPEPIANAAVPHYMPGRQSRAKDAVKQPERPKGRPAGKPNEAQCKPVVKPQPITKPAQGVTGEKATTAGCSACGVKWDKHDGLAKTCAKLRTALAELARIKSLLAELGKNTLDNHPSSHH